MVDKKIPQGLINLGVASPDKGLKLGEASPPPVKEELMKRSAIAEEIAKNFYTIPRWCKLLPLGHFDNLGGCWGINIGNVIDGGIDYCCTCEYFNSSYNKSYWLNSKEELDERKTQT